MALGLVLNRSNAIVVADLDRIGSSGQAERFRPERDAPQSHAASLAAMRSAVNPTMGPRPPDGVFVVVPDAVAVDERALPGAVREVFDGGDRNDRLEAHNRSAPRARVVSRGTWGRNATVRQAACTPTSGH